MRIIVLLLGLLSAFGPLSIDMYLPAFPLIAADFKVSLSQVELSLSSFLIGIALGQIFYGPLTDRFGRKKPLYIGLLIYCLASALCAVSTDVEQLIYLRFLQALGSCAGMVISRAVVRDLYRAQDAAKVFSLLMLIMGVAPILAPIAGGLLSSLWGWRAIFWVLSFISGLTFILMYFFLQETQQEPLPLKVKSIFSNYFLIFANRAFLSHALALSFTSAAMFSYITGASFIFVNHYGVTPTNFAMIFGLNAVGIIGASQLNGYFLARFSAQNIMKYILIYALLAATLLLILGLINPPMGLLCLGLFLYLPVVGIINPNASALALEDNRRLAGSASALLGTIQFSISGVMSALVSVFHDQTIRPMCFIIFLCAVLAFISHYLLAAQGRESI